MIFRKIMTGFAAVTVIAVSASMFGVLWNVNRFADSIDPVKGEPFRGRIGSGYAWEVIMKDGRFEKFVLYSVLNDKQDTIGFSTVGSVTDGILE